MKVGDLVQCPEITTHNGKFEAAYLGVIIGVYGHKVEVLGGGENVVGWDGTQGVATWDMGDIKLIHSA